MRGKEDYNIVSSEETHIGRFDIVFDRIERDGAVHPYSYVKMKPGVGVLAFYEGKLVLLKQYRYIWDMWMWEIPGGAVDEGETPKMPADIDASQMTDEQFHAKLQKGYNDYLEGNTVDAKETFKKFTESHS